MSLKKIKLLAVFGIFMLSILTHFLYDWFPNDLFSIFFPVNESVWEHMKILYSSILLYGIIDYILLKKWVKFNGFFVQLFLTSISSIPIFLVLYLPLSKLLGSKLWLHLILLFITFGITQLISYFMLKKMDHMSKWDTVAFSLIIVCYVIFGLLTYHPLKTDLFFDPLEKKYGLNIYRL